MSVTLIAPDCRNGGAINPDYGRDMTLIADNEAAAHALARDLNAGIYTIDGAVYESDGESFWCMVPAWADAQPQDVKQSYPCPVCGETGPCIMFGAPSPHLSHTGRY